MVARLSLLDVLAEIPDPRSRHGRRHPLTAILGLAVLAMLSGAKSYQAIAQFGRDKGFALAPRHHHRTSGPLFGYEAMAAGQT